MATLGDTCAAAWAGGAQTFGPFVDKLREKHWMTFPTQVDVHELLKNVLHKRGTPYHKLPTLADMDAVLYEYEHAMQ